MDLDRKIEKSYSDMSNKVDTMMSSLVSKFDSSISSINSKVDERGRVPWAAWSVAVAAIVAIGTLAYWPIASKQDDLAKLIDHVQANLEHMGDRLVPRGEHEEKWRSFDSQHADLKASVTTQVTNLQHQIDDISKRAADTYTLRDAMADDKQRLDNLSRTVNEMLQRMPQK